MHADASDVWFLSAKHNRIAIGDDDLSSDWLFATIKIGGHCHVHSGLETLRIQRVCGLLCWWLVFLSPFNGFFRRHSSHGAVPDLANIRFPPLKMRKLGQERRTLIPTSAKKPNQMVKLGINRSRVCTKQELAIVRQLNIYPMQRGAKLRCKMGQGGIGGL